MDDSDEDLAPDDEDVDGEAKEVAGGGEEGEEEQAENDEESDADDRDAVPGGWQNQKERKLFLRKVRREAGHRENEKEERLQALLQVRELCSVVDNCPPLWEDIEVRNALLDAMEPPNPEKGKSIYVDEGPPPNDPFVRAVATGILVHFCFDRTVLDAMSQDTKLRELLVETLQQVEPPVPDPEAEEDMGAKILGDDAPKDGPDPIESAPGHLQSRSQHLLSLLTLGYMREKGACAQVLARPSIPEPEPTIELMEEEAEEEEQTDDEEVDPDDGPHERQLLLMSKEKRERIKQRKAERAQTQEEERKRQEEMKEQRRQEMEVDIEDSDEEVDDDREEGAGEADADPAEEMEALAEEKGEDESSESEEVDPDALLAEVEDILHAVKPSSDEDLMHALCAATKPLTSEEELLLIPPWRPGAALTRRLDSLWTLAATRLAAESSGIWRFEQVREVLLAAAEVSNPENMRISALGTLGALLAFDENKRPMWEEPRLQKVLALGAAAQVPVPVEGTEETGAEPDATEAAEEASPKVMTLKPQSAELRRQAIICLLSVASGGDDIREALWANGRIVASLQDAAQTSGPLQPLAVQVIRELTRNSKNQDPMIDAGIPRLMGQILADGELLKKDLRACEIGRDRLLAD